MAQVMVAQVKSNVRCNSIRIASCSQLTFVYFSCALLFAMGRWTVGLMASRLRAAATKNMVRKGIPLAGLICLPSICVASQGNMSALRILLYGWFRSKRSTRLKGRYHVHLHKGSALVVIESLRHLTVTAILHHMRSS